MSAMTVRAFVLMLVAAVTLGQATPIANDPAQRSPFEIRPRPDGNLPYRIAPIPRAIVIDRDVRVPMADGVRLAVNVFRPARPGKYPVLLTVTPYGKDEAPPTYTADGGVKPNSYTPFVSRVHAHGNDAGHMKISMLTPWEAPDPAFWVPNGYVVVVADERGSAKSEGKTPDGFRAADDAHALVEWSGVQPWSSGRVATIGVSALARFQYYLASRRPASGYLKAIVPWESQVDTYRDFMFWGGIPETNFSRRDPAKAGIDRLPPDQAARAWTNVLDTVGNQKMLDTMPPLERITVPALVCASWSDKGLHTRGSFEVFRRIGSKDKWLYTHGGSKWERFYSDDAIAYQKKFLDYYLKGEQNGWEKTPRVRLEVRETRDEYTVRTENAFPLERTRYTKLYLNADDGSLSPAPLSRTGKVMYQSTQGGGASFGITFDRDTELTGYISVRLWVAAEDADDMDLFLAVKKFAGPCDIASPACASLETALGADRIARGNEVRFRGMNGHGDDTAARGQLRVSQRELDEALSTPWQPVQKFRGERRLTPGEVVPVDIALLPSSTMFRRGESLRLFIQGYSFVDNPLLGYEWLINRGRHAIYTGGQYDSYVQVPVIER